MCGKLTAAQLPKNSQQLLLAVTDVKFSTSQSSAPNAAGTYSLNPGTGQPPAKLAVVTYLQTDGTCHTSRCLLSFPD